MLGLPSGEDEENKQAIIQEFHRSIEPSYKQLTANMVAIDGR